MNNGSSTEFTLSHPDDSRWPCPFCIFIGKTLLQCRIHVKKDHPDIFFSTKEEFSQFLPSNSSFAVTYPSQITDHA